MTDRPALPGLMFLLCALAAPASQASLGGPVASVQDDQQQMHATRQIAPRTAYSVHELTLASGTVLREFVTPAGTVFAVAWQGPFKPDLKQLLGVHFARLVEAGGHLHGGHRALAVHAPDLVIDSGGRMRNFAGRAYLPALLPAALSTGEIR